jgi:hypothetical protein
MHSNNSAISESNNRAHKQKSGNNLLVTPTKATQSLVNTTPPTDDQWGCDYLAFSLYVSPDSIDVSDAFWDADNRRTKDRTVTYDNFKGSLMVGYARVKLYLMPLNERLKIEFNPSRVFSSSASALLFPADKIKEVTETVINVIESKIGNFISAVDPTTGEITLDPEWVNRANLSRFDATRDIWVPIEYSQQLENTWDAVTPDVRHLKNSFSKAAAKSYSIYHSTKSEGSDKLYNKTAQLNPKWHKANPTTVTYRFESTLRKGRLKTHELRTLGDITNERVWNAIETRWNKTKWGVNIRSTDTATTALAGQTIVQRQRMIGVLEEGALGILDMTQRTNKAICKRIRELGLVPGVDTIRSGEAIGFVDIHRGEVTTS